MPIVSSGPGGQPAVPAPPDPDPERAFRDAPLEGRRTAVWATVTGAALLALVLPFIFPTGDADDRTYPSLSDAAADTLPVPGSWQLTFDGLDTVCTAPDPQPVTSGLYADCGRHELDVVSMDDVSDPVHSARRAIRSVWGTGRDHLDDVRFVHPPTDSSGAAQSTGADAVWVSEPVGFTTETDDGVGGDEGYGDSGGPGSGSGGGFSPVQYGTTTASVETWVTTAALERDGDLYTVMASAGSPETSAAALQEILGGLGSDREGDRA